MGKVLKASAKMASATFTSRVLGLFREQAMAWSFGASGMTDAFTVAYRIPNMLRDLFAEGAFSSSFVPIFAEAKIEDPLKARRLLWSLFVLLGGVTLFISLLIIFFALPIAQFLTSGDFLADPLRKQVTVELIQIMAPFLTFVSLAALFMGALNSLRIFFIPALAPAFFNLVMIFSILFLPAHIEEMGYHPIISLGVGVFVGGFIQMAIQIPILFKVAYGPLGPLSFINRDTKRIVQRLGIGTIGIAANQINLIVTTILATGTVLGAVSWLTYAFRLFQFPVGILGVSIANSNLVHFSDAWKEGEKEKAVNFLRSGFTLSFFTIIPAMMLIFALGEASVHLIFERGAFESKDTQMTSLALYMYGVGLPFYGLFKILGPTFFALDKPQIPVYVSLFSITLNIIFCLIFTPIYGFSVLALGTSFSMMINSFLQIVMIKKLIELRWKDFLSLSLLRASLAGGVCFASAYVLGLYFYDFSSPLGLRVLSLSFCTLSGVICYCLTLFFLGERGFVESLTKKLKK